MNTSIRTIIITVTSTTTVIITNSISYLIIYTSDEFWSVCIRPSNTSLNRVFTTESSHSTYVMQIHPQWELHLVFSNHLKQLLYTLHYDNTVHYGKNINNDHKWHTRGRCGTNKHSYLDDHLFPARMNCWERGSMNEE